MGTLTFRQTKKLHTQIDKENGYRRKDNNETMQKMKWQFVEKIRDILLLGYPWEKTAFKLKFIRKVET